MTDREFTEWYAHHRASFPGIDRWLTKLDKDAQHDDDMRSADVLRRWRACLRDVDQADAKAATDAMMRGDLDEPRSWDSHPKAIRRAAIGRRADRKIAAHGGGPTKYRTDENGETVAVYHCPECLDDGLILVWHPTSMEAMREGTFGRPRTVYQCGVRCPCDIGRSRWKGVPVEFDASRMVRCQYHPTPEDIAALRSHIEGESMGTIWQGGAEF
jgi:hypothetical protein